MECLTISQGPQGRELAFHGSCTIEHATAIAAMLGKEMAGDSSIVFNLQQVEDADLSFFQILSACKRACINNKIPHAFVALPKDLCDMANHSGFDFCDQDT